MATKQVSITLAGVTPLLMHNVEAMRLKKPARMTHEEWEEDDACFLAKCYLSADGKQLAVPDRVLRGHLIRAAKTAMSSGIKPPKAKSWTDRVKSVALFVDGLTLDQGLGDLKKERQYVTMNKGKVLRVWPKLESWSGSFRVILADDSMLPPDAVVALFEFGGKLIGLGDYRPQYGRYRLVSHNVGEANL